MMARRTFYPFVPHNAALWRALVAELDRMNAAPDPAQTDALTTETVQ